MKSSSPSRSIPDPTFLLFLVVATVAWALLAGDETTRLIVCGVALVPVGVWLLHRLATSAATGSALLVVAAAMPRGAVEIGKMNARPEHIAAGLLCLAVPFLLMQRKQRTPWIYADFLLLAYVALTLFSSLFISVAPQQTARTAVQQTLAILPYYFLRVLAGDRPGFRWAFRVFLIVGALEAAYGVICYYSYLLFGTEFGVTVGQYGELPGPYGTQYEANLLGAYCGATAVVMLAMYVQERRRASLVGYGICMAGMAISLSRAAVGATVIGLALLTLWAQKKGWLTKRVLASVATATLLVALAILPALASSYVERFSTVDISDPTADDNTAYRVLTWGLALDSIANHPLLGNGAGSFQAEYTSEEIFVENESGVWISNSGLRVLHDTGLVGFAVFLLFLAALARKAWRFMKDRPDPRLAALLLGTVVYCVTFQFTEGTLLAFTWVHLGLIACALCLPSVDGDQLEGRLAETGTGGGGFASGLPAANRASRTS